MLRSEDKAEITRLEKLLTEAIHERCKDSNKIEALAREKSTAKSESNRLQERLQNKERDLVENETRTSVQIDGLRADKIQLQKRLDVAEEDLQEERLRFFGKEKEYYA